MIRVALSHDIDRMKRTYHKFSKPLAGLMKGDFKYVKSSMGTLFEKDSYWQFDEIIAIESKYNVKSTFFFLNESIKFDFMKPKTFVLAKGRYNILDPRIQNIIKWLDANGWEIGLHGSFESYRNLVLLKKEKLILEEIVGHKILGIRQHHLNLESNTWKYQNEIGLKYDSSFGSNYKIGFKEDKIKPFSPLNNEFLVFPQVIMDKCLMADHKKWDRVEEIFDICEKNAAVLVVNFHNNMFCSGDFPGYKEAYIEFIERAQNRSATFKTLGQFYNDFSINSI